MAKDKQKIVVIGCINPMSATKAYLDAIKENTNIVVEYRDKDIGFYGEEYSTIIIDDWLNEVTEQELIGSTTVKMQPTNPNFGKESWRKRK